MLLQLTRSNSCVGSSVWTRQISFPVSGGLGTSVLQVALGQKGLVSRPTREPRGPTEVDDEPL